MLTNSVKFYYNKEQEIQVVYLLNKQEKILPLYNNNNRLIPFPLKFLKSFMVEKPYKGKFGRIYFAYFNVVKDYTLLDNLLGESPLHLFYQNTEELTAILKELHAYFYKESLNFDELPKDKFPLFTKHNAKFANCVQEGRCVYRLRLIKSFFPK